MKKEVHAPVNKSKRFPVWLGTCTLHAGGANILDPYRVYILNVSHKHAPEQSNNRAGIISVIVLPTWPALQDREQKI